MSDKLYDILNKLQRWLPSLGAFYIVIAKIWKLPLGSQINETVVAIATLLAATLEIATTQYRKKLLEEQEADKAWLEKMKDLTFQASDEHDGEAG